MGRGRRTVAVFWGRLALLACGAGLLLWCVVGGRGSQLERLRALNNHAKHVALNMDCTACHTGARDRARAGLPSVRMCAYCHRPDRTDPPTPPELARYIKSGQEIPWVRVNRLPGHVYFSHEGHIKFGQMKCGECHGKMKDPVNPVQRPVVARPNMFVCMGCHRRRHVSADCLECHK